MPGRDWAFALSPLTPGHGRRKLTVIRLNRNTDIFSMTAAVKRTTGVFLYLEKKKRQGRPGYVVPDRSPGGMDLLLVCVGWLGRARITASAQGRAT